MKYRDLFNPKNIAKVFDTDLVERKREYIQSYHQNTHSIPTKPVLSSRVDLARDPVSEHLDLLENLTLDK